MTKTTSFAAGMPCWVDVSVETAQQREGLIAFYSALFGWEWRVGGEEMGFYSMALANDEFVLGIGQSDGGRGLMMPYFSTTDIDASAKHVAELGGTVVMPPMQVAENGSMLIAIDPVGATFGFWQPDEFPGFGVMYEHGAPGWFDHSSNDPERVATFYSELLGYPITSPDPSMRILHAGDQWFASTSLDQADRGSAMWNAIYVVDSLQKARETVTQQGGEIIVEEMPVPGSFISVFKEPVMQTSITIMQSGQHD